MSRELLPDYCYHVTSRCNNREFKLTNHKCKQVFIYALKKAIEKYQFKLYGLCIMSNHVHYLLEPAQPEDLPKIMHWLNWYTAMCFNRMLNRTGHFWEKRYFSEGFPNSDSQRVLNTLRYIHANPKTAGMQQGFFYDFSNYGSYARLTDDGLTQWHPAFLELADNLDGCAEKYKNFCNRYKPRTKSDRRSHWGSNFLPKILKLKPQQESKGQMLLPWAQRAQTLDLDDIVTAALDFVRANSYAYEVATEKFY